jgi:glutamine amidotransferase
MVVIVDYGLGNLRSVLMKFARLKIEAVVTADPAKIARADKLVLPGVGSFGTGMRNLHERGQDTVLRDRVLGEGTPILGICLGMQLFCDFGEEGDCPGLGFLPGKALHLDVSARPGKMRVPHVGWNRVELATPSPLFQGIDPGLRYYFVHSYAVFPDDPADAAAWCRYGQTFAAAVRRGAVHGTQFHPEKSHLHGLAMLKNFAELT